MGDALRGARSREEGSRRRPSVGARRTQEALCEKRSGAARIVEAVHLQRGAELVAAEDPDEDRDLELTRLDEGLDLLVFTGARRHRHAELTTDGDESVSGQNLEDASFGKTMCCHEAGSS
jgi:hypothetical protein